MTSPASPSRDRFLSLLRDALQDGTLVKLTLGKHRGSDATLRNVFVRPVELKSGAHFTFVWRHATRDITKNHPAAAALAVLEPLIGGDFLDAHLFTTTATAQLETQAEGGARLRVKAVATDVTGTRPAGHDRTKAHVIDSTAPWLRALGVTNERGRPREGMADKFRQIQKFAELLQPLLAEAFPNPSAEAELRPSAAAETASTAGPAPAKEHPPAALHVVDMGCGKGYLTFAVSAVLGGRARVRGVEVRPELVALCNRVARENHFSPRLDFVAGSIADTPLERIDALIALHACDTATDDALGKGIAAGARLLVVAPCCQKELRPQLQAPPVLADALRHGIFQERQAEFVTDALRALLLEWAGYRTRVFEFISTEHTARNLMIAAIKARPAGDDDRARRLRDFASFYGIRTQRLASLLGLELAAS